MGMNHEYSLLSFQDPYLPEYSTSSELPIRQKSGISAEKIVQGILHLSTSPFGADITLEKVFHAIFEVPFRSSFSKARSKISSSYFEDQLKNVTKVLEENRPTYGKLGIYAIDGHQLTLPLTKDLYDKGYSGLQPSDKLPDVFLVIYQTCGPQYSQSKPSCVMPGSSRRLDFPRVLRTAAPLHPSATIFGPSRTRSLACACTDKSTPRTATTFAWDSSL
jgi:hypothetical protein